jgi:hypothetical protein
MIINKLILILFLNISIFSAANGQSFSVEILSTRDINNVPPHILRQAFLGGDNPVFIMDKGLYRLVVGPFAKKDEAEQKSRELSDIFGRDMFVVNIPASRYKSAIKLKKPNTNIESIDNNEHLGFLEKQRAKVVNKYDIDPFGKVDRNQEVRQVRQVRQYNSVETMSMPLPQKNTSGLLLSLATTSSRHEFSVNGKRIDGTFSYGVQMGYRINDNTLLMASYFKPEIKSTTVYLKDGERADITSEYSFLATSGIKYRYFIPSFQSFFASLQFGVTFTKQNIRSDIPLNFGTSYKYSGWYIASYAGMGMGIRLNRKLLIGIDNTAYMTKKTITNSTIFYVNFEF